MPCTAGIKRQELNEYKEPIGEPVLITTLTWLLYKQESLARLNITLSDNVVRNQSQIKFLVDYSEESKKVKNDDFLYIENDIYKVIDTGENFEIYFDIGVDKVG
jgi:hypothetical protein